MASIDRILRAVQTRPWAVQPEKLEEIALVLAARAATGSLPDETEIHAADEIQAAARGKRAGGQGAVAVMPLFGTLSRRMNMLDAMSGGASVESFSRAFDEAMADDAVSQIVIVIDSPGGSVYGIEELFQKVYAARGNKHVTAVVDSLAASAAYYIACAAAELVVTPSGEVGSIGVYMVHFDMSGALDAEGIKPTIIRAGDHKAEGNAFEPLEDEAIAHMQMLIDDYYSQFVGAVAKGRGVSVKTVKSDFGQGRTFTARRALQRGMVDRIATLDTVLDELTGKKARRRTRRASVDGIDIAADIAAQAADALPGVISASGEVTINARRPVGLQDHDEPFEPVAAIARATDRLTAALLDLVDTTTESQGVADEGQAASQDPLAPTEPAPEAREDSMSVKDTAAPTAGAETLARAQEDARSEERARVMEIRGIAREHDIATETADRWVADGTSGADAARLALEEITKRAAGAATIRVTGDREAEKPYLSLGAQLQDIVIAGRNPDATPKTLRHLNEQWARHAAASGANISSPSDGGFVLQPDFAEGITTKMWSEGRVLPRTNRVPIGEGSNQLARRYIKEASRKDGYRYGGVRVYRANEADTVTASSQKFGLQRIMLEKLMGLYYATEEILEDSVALSAEAETGFRRELTFVAENEVFRGTGAGQCLGILNSSAVVSVAKESGQAAATVNATNVAKMMGRLPPESFPTAAWFVHSTVIPQLVLMTIGDQPVFLANNNLVGPVLGTMFGMPVVPLEYCSTAGTVGDIILADLNCYTTIDKRGVRWEESVHVRFIYDETAFKLAYRFNGQPDWEAAVAEFQGTDSVSPFVTLAARA